MATKGNSERSNADGPKRFNDKADQEHSLLSERNQNQAGCFFKTCDRETSERLLRESYAQNKQKNGIYMIRQSDRDESKFVLSLIKDAQCFHYRIHHMGNGTFLDEKTDSIFYSLDELLEYYQVEGARYLRCPLTVPLRGQALPAYAQRRGVTTPLHHAATENQRDVISQLLKDPNGPDIHAKNEEGNTPLHDACFFGRDDAVKVLLQAGANWKFVNRLGWTSLHQAALGNSPTIIDILVSRAHADVDARNPFNLYAPIHCAAACNNLEAITTLIAHDSPIRPLTDDGETPYDLAVKYNGAECAEKLAHCRSKPALSNRSSFYHGSLSSNHMQALLNYFKKSDGYFFVRQSVSVPDDFAISIIWQSGLVHVKLHKKANSYYFEDRLHYHDSLEHAVDYFVKVYKGVVKPLSPEVAKVAYTNVSLSASTQRHHHPPSVKVSKTSASQVLHDSSSADVTTLMNSSAIHPFHRNRGQNMHNKQNMVSTIEQRLINPLVNKKVVSIREDQLTIGQLLGEGNFGKVYAGEYRGGNGEVIRVAIKALKANMDERSREELKKETYVMKELSHPCIVRLYGISQSKTLNSILMVQELLSMGSLLDYLKSHADNSIYSLFSYWIVQIIHGMAYMERKRFVHRDLAARNILMQSHSRIKISDFGLSRSVDSNDYYLQQSNTPIPIPWYAPESLDQGKFTSKSDVWSFGVTMWEIYSFGQYPYSSLPNEEIYLYVMTGARLPRPAGCSSLVYDVMLRCWAAYAHDRPSFPELLQILSNRSEFTSAAKHFRSFSKY